MRLSLTYRAGVRAIFALLSAALLSQIVFVPMAAQAQAQPDWLVAVNNYRILSGLPAVVADSASTTAAINHSRYIVQNNTWTHTEVVAAPGYTASGASAGSTGAISTSMTLPDPVYAIVTTQLTANYDPGLTSIGYGTATYQDVFPGQTNTTDNIATAQTVVFNTTTPVTAPSGTPFVLDASSMVQLVAGQQLNAGQQLVSVDGKTKLLMQTDGNLCLYRLDSGASLWCSGTNKPGKYGLGAYAGMDPDGDFDVYSSDNWDLWTSHTAGNHSGASLVLSNDGNLSIFGPTQGRLWSTGTAWSTPTAAPTAGAPGIAVTTQTAAPTATPVLPAPTATAMPGVPTATPGASDTTRLVAGQQLTVNQPLTASNGTSRLLLQSDGNLVLYRSDNRVLWQSGTVGKPMVQVLMQTDGNLAGYNANLTVTYWNAGTNGHPGASLILRNDGNLLVVDANGTQLWATNTTVS